jgi:hypothetical protein
MYNAPFHFSCQDMDLAEVERQTLKTCFFPGVCDNSRGVDDPTRKDGLERRKSRAADELVAFSIGHQVNFHALVHRQRGYGHAGSRRFVGGESLIIHLVDARVSRPA